MVGKGSMSAGPQDEAVCPVCGRWVGTRVRRHKTLGVFVPLWGPGPCRNPECSAYVDPAEEETEPPKYHRPDRHQVREHLERTWGPAAIPLTHPEHAPEREKSPKREPGPPPGGTAGPQRTGQEPEATQR